MKRPQFGLRLMFLVVTLVAVCLGWRAAVVRWDTEAKHRDLVGFREVLPKFEKSQTDFEAELQSNDPSLRTNAAFMLRVYKHVIADIKAKIKELSD
jgi:hypothetical protein